MAERGVDSDSMIFFPQISQTKYTQSLFNEEFGFTVLRDPRVFNRRDLRETHLKRIRYIREMKEFIIEAWSNRELLREKKYSDAVRNVIEEVDKGRLRAASPSENGWQVNEWVKQAILLYFSIQEMKTWEIEPFEFYDRIPLKKNYKELGVRAVPHAVARYGAYIARNVVLMPSYVNIGSYVDEGTMVDTWATVGTCAQIGKHVHLSGGVGIGGVLEPLQASPVIIEDGCFIGSRCIVVEGVVVEKEAVLGANVVLTQSTKIIDVSGSEPREMKGRVPARSVVIPGSYTKKFPAGEYGVGCALIIGQRKPSTDLKTSLNDALRDFNVSG
jgi:2,3,4,5-tetrahydropyridine-2-carboxylate N-succinyltransferase